jgi:hypothetical protein
MFDTRYIPKENNIMSIKTASELKNVVELDKLYSRQEVAGLVGVGWANVMEASKAMNGRLEPSLKGKLILVGKVETWMFTGQSVLDWRLRVESRKPQSNTLIIPLSADPEVADKQRKLILEAVAKIQKAL